MAYTTEITYTSSKFNDSGRYIKFEPSQILLDKVEEYKASGDIISNDVQKTGEKMIVTRVWKNEEACNSHLAWFESSGQKSIYNTYLVDNGITVIKKIL